MSPFEKQKSSLEELTDTVIEIRRVEDELTNLEDRHEAASQYRIVVANLFDDIKKNEPANLGLAESRKKTAEEIIKKLES